MRRADNVRGSALGGVWGTIGPGIYGCSGALFVGRSGEGESSINGSELPFLSCMMHG